VRIEDDGAGFQLEEIEAKGGCIGILGMQERALYVGGTVRVETAPGRGTTVVLRLPLGDGARSGESSLRVMGSTPPAAPHS
jgi:signal transduction histidine kinase